jgi:hypothetical protein
MTAWGRLGEVVNGFLPALQFANRNSLTDCFGERRLTGVARLPAVGRANAIHEMSTTDEPLNLDGTGRQHRPGNPK